MTEAETTTDRGAKWMRYAGLALALIWATSCTVTLASIWLLPPRQDRMIGFWVVAGLFALPPWAAAVIPWRWEGVGANVLLVEGLAQSIALSLLIALGLTTWYGGASLFASVSGPAFVLAILITALPALSGILFRTRARRLAMRSGVVPAGAGARWVGSTARTLAVVWAAFATFAVVAGALLLLSLQGFPDYPEPLVHWVSQTSSGFWLMVALLALIPWASAAAAWRWEATGGVVLLLQGALLFPLAIGVLPLTAGILFLVTWRKSRTSGSPRASELDPGRAEPTALKN